MSDGPVFLGGLSFSGKAQLRVALCAHPRIAITRHTALWDRYWGRFGDLDDERNLERCMSVLMADADVAALLPDRDAILGTFRRGPRTYAALFATFHHHHAQQQGKARWGDQMKSIERHADLLLGQYPDAQMIHMVRDPRARTIASGRHHRRSPGRTGWETARWLSSVDTAERNRRRYPGRYLVVRYEALAAEPRATLEQVTAFLGERSTPQMVDALEGVRLDPSSALLPYETPLRAHDRAMCAFVERHALRRLQALGYPPSSRQRGRPGATQAVTAWPFELAGLVAGRAASGFAVAPRGGRRGDA